MIVFWHESLKTVKNAGLVKELPEGKREVERESLMYFEAQGKQTRLRL